MGKFRADGTVASYADIILLFISKPVLYSLHGIFIRQKFFLSVILTFKIYFINLLRANQLSVKRFFSIS